MKIPTNTHPALLIFIGFFGLLWCLAMMAYYLVRIVIYLILLVFKLCQLAAAALSPSLTA